MIHNSSSDPVLIKKISLKIWSLRDEIEVRIQENLASGSTPENLDLMKIREQFTPKILQINNLLPLKSTDELDSGEDEMARAMAGLDEAKNEENSNEDEEKNENEENHLNSETPSDDMTASSLKTSSNIININPNIISISLDAPNIPADKISKGKTVLSEISMDKMFFFCNRPFTEGQSIVIQFCIPNSFIINADILYCRPFNLKSRIISQNNYTHRALIRFNFLKEGERALLRQFLKSIEPDVAKTEKKSNGLKNDGDDSGFGDLDDLGL